MKNPPSTPADRAAEPDPAAIQEPSPMAAAVLKELERLLERLLRLGQGGSVDLGSLPLGSADRDALQTRLGRGEVEILLEAGGHSRLLETGLPGVWWVQHHDETGAPAAESLDVSWVPPIVPAHPDDVRAGLEGLKRKKDC